MTELISESFLNQSISNEEQANQLKNINFEKDIIQRINEEYISKSPNSNNIILDLPKKEIIDFNDPIFKEYNYIITPEIKEKLCLLYTYMKNQIPCILEGETGTSKTFSTIILSKYLSKNWEKENLQKDFKVLRFNLSSESKASDLLGKYVGDQKSFAGIVFETGVFIKAFSEGHCLLLDEINLASPALFQCIEEALDTKILSIEVPGLPLKQFKMHKNFCLVATQNPNKGNFLRKRNELKSQILSRFQIISFEEFNEEELLKICLGLINKEESEKYKDIISDLIKFHIKLNKQPEITKDIFNFTLREISLFIQALTDKNNKYTPYELILIIYGSKYPKVKLSIIDNLLNINEFKFISKNNIRNSYIDEIGLETNFINI